ncbi:MAG TPA: pantoate--beta-alanine ligase [Edaphobacter sp.]|uniref:pantoate--beta-alanine ligase n=1 Tax=Edaphobacter sp. TaxID=1934404 RepID=UPI002BA80D63|nr:pantoate--beta-alanine ligase [Edaphobacter sp.]HUZ96636.1 pantoate--beta-alanine ligase [Edaphobacter sp.]
MKIVETVAEMQHLCRNLRTENAPLGLVPTMGALHAGHLSLVRRARSECASIAATIFVNPLQFGPNEDLAKYPRTFDEDCRQLADEGVSLLFAPTTAEMYPPGAATTISVTGIGDRLDGASRPGHFTGVATVVAKLFHIAHPHRAFFGQKDAAQLAVLRQMARDLNFDLEIIGCPIVRDADGLALSSRNKYLSPAERTEALALPRALRHIQQSIASGERQSDALIQQGMQELNRVKLDYLATVDAQTLLPVSTIQPGTLIAVAAWVGQTRLIDNFLVENLPSS